MEKTTRSVLDATNAVGRVKACWNMRDIAMCANPKDIFATLKPQNVRFIKECWDMDKPSLCSMQDPMKDLLPKTVTSCYFDIAFDGNGQALVYVGFSQGEGRQLAVQIV